MIQIASTVLDMVFLLEQINTSPGTWYVAIDLANTIFLIPAPNDYQNPSSIPLQYYLRDIVALQPSVIT